jgi:hypothetical protein
LQNSNAMQFLRDVAYRYDDSVSVPETNQYYELVILDPDVPNEEKGDWTIDAHGSVALVEQAAQDQFLLSLGPLVLNPAYGWSPKKWATAVAKTRHLNPKELEYTEEEQKKLDEAPPPAAPQIEVAKIAAATREKEIAARTQDAQADNEREDRALLTNVTVELHTLQLKKELALMDYAQRSQKSLTDAQAELANTTIRVQAQERMAKQKTPKQVAQPAFEPAGRAANGRAFEQ